MIGGIDEKKNKNCYRKSKLLKNVQLFNHLKQKISELKINFSYKLDGFSFSHRLPFVSMICIYESLALESNGFPMAWILETWKFMTRQTCHQDTSHVSPSLTLPLFKDPRHFSLQHRIAWEKKEGRRSNRFAALFPGSHFHFLLSSSFSQVENSPQNSLFCSIFSSHQESSNSFPSSVFIVTV